MIAMYFFDKFCVGLGYKVGDLGCGVVVQTSNAKT